VINLPEPIEAIYENGVLKALDPIDLKEHERVEIIITSKSRWTSEFKKLLALIHERTKIFPPEEIEADITKAYEEVHQK
jgi:predicted DNA-binding antitoxin AbrB/MazE fold protein